MASHLYDLIEYFAGPIRRIAAMTGNLVQDYRSEDASTTLLELDPGRRPRSTVSSAFPTRPAARGWKSTAPRAPFSPKERSAKARPGRRRRSSTWAKQATTPRSRKTWSRKFRPAGLSGGQSLHGRVQLLCRLHPPQRSRPPSTTPRMPCATWPDREGLRRGKKRPRDGGIRRLCTSNM